MIEISVTNAVIYIVTAIIISTALTVILNQTYVSGRVKTLEAMLEELNQHLEAIEMRPRAIVAPAPVQKPVQPRVEAPQPVVAASEVVGPIDMNTVDWWRDQ